MAEHPLRDRHTFTSCPSLAFLLHRGHTPTLTAHRASSGRRGAWGGRAGLWDSRLGCLHPGEGRGSHKGETLLPCFKGGRTGGRGGPHCPALELSASGRAGGAGQVFGTRYFSWDSSGVFSVLLIFNTQDCCRFQFRARLDPAPLPGADWVEGHLRRSPLGYGEKQRGPEQAVPLCPLPHNRGDDAQPLPSQTAD